MFPARVMEVEAGFPRMALGIAYHLHNFGGYQESVSKSLAKSMVEVWIKYEVSYNSQIIERKIRLVTEYA